MNPFINQCDWKEMEFHHTKKTGKSLNQIINQLLLMYYMFQITLKK